MCSKREPIAFRLRKSTQRQGTGSFLKIWSLNALLLGILKPHCRISSSQWTEFAPHVHIFLRFTCTCSDILGYGNSHGSVGYIAEDWHLQFHLQTKNLRLTRRNGWSWDFVDKRTVILQLRKSPAPYGTQNFIAMFTRTRHWSLSWGRSIQFIIVIIFL
jgi:hypothetical protein